MKKFIKKWSPDTHKTKQHRFLAFFGERIHESALWHINRRSVALAVFVGLFCAWVPIPFQTISALLLAFWWRCNIPISVGLIWITNPITLPPMFYAAYRLGAFLLDRPAQFSLKHIQMSPDWFVNEVSLIWQPLLLGSLICGITMAGAGYLLVNTLWRLSTARKWKKRQKTREK